MAKDREGKFQPGKGKPSGSGKEEGVGLHSAIPHGLKQYLEIADKYTEGADEVAANVHIRHPNRNVNKGEDRFEEKKDNLSNKSNKSRNETFTEERATTIPVELPGILTKEILADLANYKSDFCASVYIATHPSGVEVNEQMDPIAFKNALQDIAASLKERGMEARAQSMLEPGYELLRNEKFWYNLGPGLAVFIADGFFRYIRMPVTPREELLVNTSFYLQPLVPVMTSKDHFFVLMISKKQAKFFRADAFGMEPMRIDELPDGVDDVVHFEEKDDQKLWRTGSSGAGGGANYHGIGAGKPDEKTNIALYLEEVDRTLREEVLNTQKAPLFLVGVEYLISIYRKVSNYNFIWEDQLTGNHEYEDLNTIYKQVREKMEPYFRGRVKQALENYGNQSATELTSSVPADVIPAAHYRRVWHLFVQKDEHIWGTFDEMNNELEIHDTQQEGDECLLDKSVIKTLLNGGEVHFLDKQDMPADSKIAALMRY